MDPTSLDRIFYIYFSPHEAHFKDQLQSKGYQAQLLQLSKDYFGSTVRLQVEFKEAGESLASRKQREQQERQVSIKDRAEHHPIIMEAKSLFGGKLGPINIREVKHANTQA